MDTNMRQAIPSQIRLAVTLRYLATGDSYTTLMYLFHISKQSISKIIPEVCKSIIDALKEYVKVRVNKNPEKKLTKIFIHKKKQNKTILKTKNQSKKKLFIQIPINVNVYCICVH